MGTVAFGASASATFGNVVLGFFALVLGVLVPAFVLWNVFGERPASAKLDRDAFGKLLAAAALVALAWGQWIVPSYFEVTSLDADADGTWRLRNGLGVTLGAIAKSTPRWVHEARRTIEFHRSYRKVDSRPIVFATRDEAWITRDAAPEGARAAMAEVDALAKKQGVRRIVDEDFVAPLGFRQRHQHQAYWIWLGLGVVGALFFGGDGARRKQAARRRP